MRKKVENVPRESEGGTLSRRQIIAGAAVVAFAAKVPLAMASSRVQGKAPVQPRLSRTPMRRYMAAAAAMSDGRILVSGGYDRPLGKGSLPVALSSAAIYDPASGQWTSIAPMAMPRARHAAVALSDGRIAVLGGISMSPTASVEVYDPGTNTWSNSTPLSQPRYDHTAATIGGAVYVLGGSSQSMLSSVEVVTPGATTDMTPLP